MSACSDGQNINTLNITSILQIMSFYIPSSQLSSVSIANALIFHKHLNHAALQMHQRLAAKLALKYQIDFAAILTVYWMNILGSSMTLGRITTHPKFDPTGDRTHDLQIMTVHFMSLRRLL